jgi:hypothetical protein
VLGAHYDHVGYRETGPPAGGGQNPGGCEGQVRPEPQPGNIIFNGADDDGSGTVTVMGVARAFAQGAKPKRSLLFVWFTAEESGLQGSRFKADYPVVPNENIVAMLNADMVGRNRCDLESEANTVYLVGSDRISTDLHNLSEDANAALPQPMKLDYEFNDPADPQSLYTRSDHYSYAAKGIPVIFYTTGLHKDYHWVTDEVERIEFDKMARIGQLIHRTMMDVANQDRPPARDNLGPRAGKGSSGKLGTGRLLRRITSRDRGELVILLAALLVLGLALGFAELAGKVLEGDTQQFDERILASLRDADDPQRPIGPRWLHGAALDITALGSATVLGLTVFAVCGFLALQGLHRYATFVLVASVGGWFLNAALKAIFSRPRPEIVPHLREVMTLSFPSGHALTSAAVFLTLGVLLMRVARGR